MADKNIHMLSTIDNPFNPFIHFDEWNQYDMAKGYNTLSYLGRLVDYDDCITEEQRHIAREDAIQNIVDHDPRGIYIKVTKDEEVKPVTIFEGTT